MGRTIGAGIPLLPQDVRQSYMKPRRSADRGPHAALTRGYWVRQKTITVAIYITSRRRGRILYWDQRSFSHNIANCQI
jgi:hypothetical protein